jgi:hypothetical protein
MTFYTQYNRPPTVGETNSGEQKTDTIYIPMSDLIRDFVAAGGRLQRAREEYYHDKYGRDEMEDFTPLANGADPTEAAEYVEAVSTHLEEVETQIAAEAEAASNGNAESAATTSAGQSSTEAQGNASAEGVANLQGGT